MAKTSILLKMGLDTSKMKAGLANAGKQVGGFASTAMDKLSSVAKLASGALVGGFIAAAKSALSYGREMNNLAKLSGESFENFQALAGGAKKVGVENDKLGDILKDVNDKIGDFIQTGGGPMKDFFENIAPQIGVTAEQFKNLSGKDALQLYYDSLEKVNLSNQDMTFYMEAIASDATALIPLLKNGGKAWAEYALEMRKAGLVMDEETRVALEDAQAELDRFGVKSTVVAGTVVKNFRTMNLVGFQPTAKELESMHDKLTKTPAMAGKAMADSLKSLTDNLSKFTNDTSTSMSSFVKETTIDQIIKIEAVTEADRKAKKERDKIQKELDKIDEKIAGERQKRIELEQTATEALAAAEKERLEALAALQVAAASGDDVEVKKAQLKYAESLTKEAKSRLKVKEELATSDKEIADSLKTASELSAKIAIDTFERLKEEKLLSEQVKLQAELKEAIAKGDTEAVKVIEEALEVEEEIVQVIRDHGVLRDQAVAHVTALRDEERKLADEKQAEADREEAQAAKMIGMERDLLDAVLSGDEMAARAAQKKIDLEQRAQQIMQDLKVDYQEAYEIAKKLAAIEAGPDLNDSGFVTRFEQKEFDRQQKEKQKILDKGLADEERDQRERGGNIRNVSDEKRDRGTVRERAAAAKELREQRKANQRINRERDPEARKAMIEAEDKRRADVQNALKPKVGAPPLGPDGKPVGPGGQPVDANGNPVPGGGGGGGNKPAEPKKPEQVMADLQGELAKQTALLGDINKSLQC